MEKKVKLSSEQGAAILFGGLYMANFLSAMWTGYPFIYCHTMQFIRYMHYQIGMPILGLSLCFIGYHLIGGKPIKALPAIGFMLVYTELPNILDFAFKFGGSCG